MDIDVNEVVSPAEEAFERWRKGIGLFLGPVVFIILYLMPAPSLTMPAHRLTAVLGFVLVYWLAEPVPLSVTALLGAVLAIVTGVAPASQVLAPFAHPLVFLFIGSFMLAEALATHGLDRRFAFAIFSVPFLRKNPLRMLLTVGLISGGLSMWISNTAATAMLLPIVVGVLGVMKEMHSGRGVKGWSFRHYATAMMLMTAYGASVGGIATPIGTPPNLIGIGMIQQLTGLKITFFEWMAFAMPVTLVMFGFLFFILGAGGAFGHARLEGMDGYLKEARAGIGPWTRGQINTLIAFVIAVVLWVVPSVIALALGKDAPVARLVSSRLNEGVVALIAATLLFVLPVSFKERRFTLDWAGAVRIDWGTIFLFGGGLSLGALMFSTGLAAALGSSLTGLTGATTLWTITAMGTAVAIILSETTSNTASANMVIPVMIAVAQNAGVSPVPPALGACLGASFGFMLPVSTPPNAIVYGSGMVSIVSMVRKGILFDIGGFVIIMLGLMVLCPLMGWM